MNFNVNKIDELQEKLNDACREVYEQFRKMGKCFDFSLRKVVSRDELSEEHYSNLLENDEDDEIRDRIQDECPWCADSMFDSDYWSRSSCLCIGVSSDGERVYALVYNLNDGECFEMQIWGFDSDFASTTLNMMEELNNAD